MENSKSSQLRGIVVITSPPADDLLLGKTVTVRTSSGPLSIPSQQLQRTTQNSHVEQPQILLQVPSHPENLSSSRRLHLANSRIYVVLQSIYLITLMWWCFGLHPVGYISFNFDDGKTDSFVFPFFPNWVFVE